MYRIHSGTSFGRPLRYRIEAMKMNADRKKITTRLMNRVVIVFFMVEIRRIELLTSCMPCKRSPS